MMQRMRDAATLMFLGALVLTIKATPVDTMGALTPDAQAAPPQQARTAEPATVEPAAQPQPSVETFELPLPVSPDRRHAVLDLSRLAELSDFGVDGEEMRQVIVLRLDTDVVETLELLEETCTSEAPDAADRC